MNRTENDLPNQGPLPPVDALVGQVAMRVTARLGRACEDLPHDISERLRFSRERALAQRRRSMAPATAAAVVASGPVAALGGPPSVWLRLASLLPLAVLAAGLVFIQQHHDLQQIEVAAEIDSALLADDLPPDAYSDPGFVEFLHGPDKP